MSQVLVAVGVFVLIVVVLTGSLIGACYLAQELRCWRCSGAHSCGCRPPPPSVRG